MDILIEIQKEEMKVQNLVKDWHVQKLASFIEDLIEKDRAEQLRLHNVTFCLPIEGDTFESWHHRHFTMNADGSIVAIKNETIKYTQDQILELWSFLTDRLLAN